MQLIWTIVFRFKELWDTKSIIKGSYQSNKFQVDLVGPKIIVLYHTNRTIQSITTTY